MIGILRRYGDVDSGVTIGTISVDGASQLMAARKRWFVTMSKLVSQGLERHAYIHTPEIRWQDAVASRRHLYPIET